MLPDDVLDRKIAALRAQATQTTWLIDEMGEDDYRAWLSVEVFAEAPPS